MSRGVYVALLVILTVLVHETAAQVHCETRRQYYGCGWIPRRRCSRIVCAGIGSVTCTCPGNGASVSYGIACSNRSPTHGHKDCSKYNNCATCHGRVGEFDGGCISCRPGFSLIAASCNTDTNECLLSPCEHTCTNTHGSYVCSCRTGFHLEPNGRCTDINECLRTPCEHFCTNTHGSYTCSCRTGFDLQPNGRCPDINECLRSPCSQICTNSIGSFACSCRTGFTMESNGQCTDINECLNSPCGHTCTNTAGSYICSCNVGYQLLSNGSCPDIDECSNSPCEQTCTNNVGSYTCSCGIGYNLTSGGRCPDIDECLQSPCHHECTNTNGSYVCSCRPGFALQMNGRCIDVNECLQSPCEQICTNTQGSYFCSCRPGYVCQPNGSCTDINECLRSPCKQVCTNTIGSFVCSCRTGFTMESNGNCLDNDECLQSPCEHMCSNTIGSFSCLCRSGFTLQPNGRCNDVDECLQNPCPQTCANTPGSYQCSCYSGYSLQPSGECYDIDECQQNPCEQTCINTRGSYHCTCHSGYILQPAGRCLDIDECLQSPCQQTCKNTIGSFVCSCRKGFDLQPDGRCTDINECTQQSPCQHTCTNTDGSYLCSCLTGFNLQTDGRCADIDECLQDPCQHLCANTPGSYQCSCRSGFSLQAAGRCYDIDECLQSPCEHTCTNNDGSYTCSCNVGYNLASDGRCPDIDECQQNPCEQTCINTRGSYHCTCHPGYILQPAGRCLDIDECLESPCQHICKNTIGSFVCSCRAGFELQPDGRCADINECLQSPCEQTCTNTDGSYVCSCQTGFNLQSGGRCADINECLQNPCQHKCNNTLGSYQCSCQSGYSLQAAGRCYDIDECLQSPCEHTCTNNDGSFICSCNVGYSLVSDGRCSDIDECLQSPCEHNCTNSVGSYTCSCNVGYYLLSAGRCAAIKCDPPQSIAHGTLSSVSSRMANYTRYTCQSGFLLHGNVIRECVADTTIRLTPFWNGTDPTCTDTCQIPGSHSKQQCGPPDITQSECLQLGCCFWPVIAQPSCYFRQESTWLMNRGELVSTVPRLTLAGFNAVSCGYNCSLTSWCGTFVIRRQTIDGVNYPTCYLYDKTRSELERDGNLSFTDETSELYEPLSTTARSPDDQVRLNATFIGCYDVVNGIGSSRKVWSSVNNSPARCVTACRQQGYTLAELQNGTECYCKTESVISHNVYNSSLCITPCAERSRGTIGMCGGMTSRSVYRVPPDSRYVGCFDSISPTSFFPMQLWTRTTNASASDCISDCRRRGYLFAALHNRQRCNCGNPCPTEAEEPYDRCRVRCLDSVNEDCGGPSTQAVYATALGMSSASGLNSGTVYRNIYSKNTRTTEFPLQLFTIHRRLKSVTMPRLVIRVTGTIETLAESTDCPNGICYSACSVLTTNSLQNQGSDQVVRFFHLNLSQLSQLVGQDARRVFVYAQSVLIDSDLSFPFSLLIFTRQMIIDRREPRIIRVSSTSPTFDLNFNDLENFGVQRDLMFSKQCFACARILLERADLSSVNTAWGILSDLGGNEATATGGEQTAWFNSARMFSVFLRGINRHGVRFVPFYSIDYFRRMFRMFQDHYADYSANFARVVDESTPVTEYVTGAERLLRAYSLTSVFEEQVSLEASATVLVRSNSTFSWLYNQYQVAIRRTTSDRPRLVDSSQNDVFGVTRLVVTYLCEMGQVRRARATVLERLFENVFNVTASNFSVSLGIVDGSLGRLIPFANLAGGAVADIKRLDRTTSNFMRIEDLLQDVASMKEVTVHWQNIVHHVTHMLRHPTIQSDPQYTEYVRDALDMTNWGSTFTSSAIEHAELLRDAIQKRYTLSAKRQQLERNRRFVDDLRTGNNVRLQLTAAMVEQLLDVQIDVNNLLFTFCQAYFFNNLQPCPAQLRPSFGHTLPELLTKMETAFRDPMLVSTVQATVSRQLVIVDGVNCTECPVNVFRRTGVLRYRVDVNNPILADLSNYRIRTISWEFVGARSTNENSRLRVTTDSSGLFQSRETNVARYFVTSSRALPYEYDVSSGETTTCTDMYASFRNTVQHVTPYTTWVVHVSRLSRGIDFSGLTQIRMRLVGVASNVDYQTNQNSGNPCN